MRMNEVTYDTGTAIDGYGDGFYRVGGERVEGALLVLPSGVTPWEGLDDLGPLLQAAGAVDVLLMGMGAEIAHLPDPIRAKLEAAGLGVDVMSSPSACRTYNVLLGEGRRVGLAALPV